MKRPGALGCVLLMIALPVLTVLGEPVDEHAEALHVGITIGGAAAGLLAGTSIGLAFSADAIDTPLSNTLLLTVPVAAAGAAAGAIVGRWIADVVLQHQPSPLFAVVEGAGLGFVGGAVIGGVTFSLNFVIAYHLLEVPEGYWGDPPIPPAAMAVLAGGVWGGFFGMVGGAVAIPLVSLVMEF